MKLIIIYGSPAVGKLTVARALARIMKYPVFHNHLVADLAKALFPFGTPEYAKFAERLRFDFIDAALEAKVSGFVMTFVYGLETYRGRKDDAVLRTIANRVRRRGGHIYFVHLICDEKELLKRVRRADRKKFGKVTDPKLLATLRRHHNLDVPVPFAESFVIDTTHTSPAAAVHRIVKKYRFLT